MFQWINKGLRATPLSGKKSNTAGQVAIILILIIAAALYAVALILTVSL